MFVPLVAHDDHDWRSDGPDRGRWFVVDPRSNVLVVDGGIPSGARPPVESGNIHLLGLEHGQPVWAVEASEGAGTGPDGVFIGLRQLYGTIPDRDWALAGRAAQVLAWDRDHRFCGRCGRPTEPHPRDRARSCEPCGLAAYPRLNPAVIMLIERDDEVLLARGPQFPPGVFSALAGFVEPGESLEEAVAREVAEEVGVTVGDISYFGSQPWPFPHSMMIGFNARYLEGEVACQEEEILEAGWFGLDDLPRVPRGGISIAGWLIEDWVRRRG